MLSYTGYVTAGVAMLRCYNTDRTTFVTHISPFVMFVDAFHPSKLCPKLKRKERSMNSFELQVLHEY